MDQAVCLTFFPGQTTDGIAAKVHNANILLETHEGPQEVTWQCINNSDWSRMPCIPHSNLQVLKESIIDYMKFLFSMNGELQRYSIHYDWKGRSKGTGEVVFACQSDALAAIDRYDNMRLHGKRMKIELVVGVSNSSPAAMLPVTKDLVENPFRCKIPKDVVVLKKLRKGKHESLRNYVRRYWAMYDEVEKNTCSEQLAVAFFKQSLPHGDRLWTSLVMSPVSSIAAERRGMLCLRTF